MQLVKKLDVKVTDTGRIHVYYCEYAKAEDLAATLSALTGGGGAAAKSKSKTGSTPATPAVAVPRSLQQEGAFEAGQYTANSKVACALPPMVRPTL